MLGAIIGDMNRQLRGEPRVDQNKVVAVRDKPKLLQETTFSVASVSVHGASFGGQSLCRASTYPETTFYLSIHFRRSMRYSIPLHIRLMRSLSSALPEKMSPTSSTNPSRASKSSHE